MNILHYTLGLPPYRKGGLTKYATDLMMEQTKQHNVLLLYPVSSSMKPGIYFEKATSDIKVYKLRSYIPIPLLDGIKTPSDFMEKTGKSFREAVLSFLKREKVDILHLHTLMGLPFSFVEEMKKQGVKIIYTTHDYFGLCPKVNFINERGVNCENDSLCSPCNFNAPSTFYLRQIRNSSYLLRFKDLLKKIRSYIPVSSKEKRTGFSNEDEKKYAALRRYYIQILSLVDCFHFNSSVSKKVYLKYISPAKCEVINILHADIRDNRKKKQINKENVRIGYIGSSAPFKGLPLLLDVLKKIKENKINNWTLCIIGDFCPIDKEIAGHVDFRKSYNYENMESIFSQFDIIIMPSLCNETLGFVALEAISFGVPVLLSDSCGVKDIIGGITPDLIIKMNKETLFSSLDSLLKDPQSIESYNTRILNSDFSFDFLHHVGRINQLYEKLLDESFS
ncbi:glycosyltransferase [Parabacteroides sp. Marseille-P3160]|uniref:glycosyltransferase n=1 Tax=Parabacteroides sp. Marseille-P3160 TaxID=1917887 RepID=UPI0009B97859|nr:glycosyltransferase [Parabacteroides sp. Marseille-P3160]